MTNSASCHVATRWCVPMHHGPSTGPIGVWLAIIIAVSALSLVIAAANYLTYFKAVRSP